jgi:hypothetical protein
MFCDKCESLLDLDTSFPPDTDGGADPRVAHHGSYWTLCRAARAGCEFCQLVVENSRGGGQEMPLRIVPSSKWQVSVEFSHDGIMINIPMPIGYDGSEQDKSTEDYDIGEDNIRLYISTEYGQLPH